MEWKENKEGKYFEVMYKGELVECMKEKDGNYKVIRLISTSPNAFLKKCYMPGNILDMRYVDMNKNEIETNKSKYF